MSTAISTKQRVQSFGRALSAMVMPNIGAFIAWGLITALFIPTGWIPNENLSTLVGPMITYLLPLLIGYTAGKNVYGVRGGVMGAIVTMGVISGADVPMFMGAMIVGPLGGFVIKKFDEAVQDSIPAGFEMLVNNFSVGIIGTILSILAYLVIGPVAAGISQGLGAAVNGIVNAGLLPLVSIFIEPAKILFLNNAINHGVLTPLGAEQVATMGKSIFFMLETNPGPGLGILIAYWLFAKGSIKDSAPGAMIIHFLGGIHEIYFPYVLMNPVLVIAVIAGGMSGVMTFSIFGAGLVGSPSPGSIFAYMAMTPRGGYIGVLAGVLISTIVSCLVASFFVKRSADKLNSDELEKSKSKVKGMKAESKGTVNLENVTLIAYACDAGMGSSAMGASLLGKRLKKAGYDIKVKNFEINNIPAEAGIVVTHEQLTDRAKTNAPGAYHISITDFLDTSVADQIESLLKKKVGSPTPAKPVVKEAAESGVLSKENILQGLPSVGKEDAIRAAGERLVSRGYAAPEYIEAMLQRERDISTYIGKGVAIPHGVSSAKNFIKKSGVVILQYPNGVDFNGELAYLVIGIAGLGDDHLQIISQLAEIIDSNEIEQIKEIAASKDLDYIYDLFSNQE